MPVLAPRLLVAGLLLLHLVVAAFWLGSLPPLVWSALTAWSGTPLERNLCRGGAARSVFFPVCEIILVTKGQISVEYRSPTTSKRFVAGPGSVTGMGRSASRPARADGSPYRAVVSSPTRPWPATSPCRASAPTASSSTRSRASSISPT